MSIQCLILYSAAFISETIEDIDDFLQQAAVFYVN
jgi:hypothetical protein